MKYNIAKYTEECTKQFPIEIGNYYKHQGPTNPGSYYAHAEAYNEMKWAKCFRKGFNKL